MDDTGTPATVSALLPLPPHVFQVMLALFDHDRHGYALLQEVSRQSGGGIVLGTSTLYAALKRMRRLGLIEETTAPPEADSRDSRRRYYRLTAFGRDVARAEAERVRLLNKTVLASGVLGVAAGRGRA